METLDVLLALSWCGSLVLVYFIGFAGGVKAGQKALQAMVENVMAVARNFVKGRETG